MTTTVADPAMFDLELQVAPSGTQLYVGLADPDADLCDTPKEAPMTTTPGFRVGDVIRIGKGYQRWTVAAVAANGDLTVVSDPSFQAIASGCSTRTRTVSAGRATLLRSADEA